jgi:hypothetical protein
MIANGKHRKSEFSHLKMAATKYKDRLILEKIITYFYRDLFGELEENFFTLDESITVDLPQVSSQENGLLTIEFFENEIKEAIFSMKPNKAPSLDGFPAEFYQ